MNELKRIEEKIQSAFSESSYPQEFLDAYDQMECLASRSGRETFLVRRKETGEMAVAKCYDRAAFPFRAHPELLEEPPEQVCFDQGLEYHEPKPLKQADASK